MAFVVRDLELSDFNKDFPDILNQLTTVGEVSLEKFTARFNEVSSSPDYKIVVIEGHIEDVVVDKAYRGKQLGQRVIEALLIAAKDSGCYKVILDCAESNSAFYEKCGLTRKEVQMVKYF